MRTIAVVLTCWCACASAAAAPFRVEEATIEQLQRAILDGKTTSTEIVRAYLARARTYDGTCVRESRGVLGPIEPIARAKRVNALITINLRPAARKTLGFDARKARSMTDAADADPNMPDALEVAAEQDRAFAKTHKLVGPLHGVVLAIKDQLDTFDLRTTAGADADYANDRPPADATVVKRLRGAGAIILGKSNMGDYASAVPRSSFGGATCNPYDSTKSPRGSSSGSAAAVAANLVTCALAEEAGASIRGPASACGVVGLAPTTELVSRAGLMERSIAARVGPMCRTVEDTARVLGVIAGEDPKDPITALAKDRVTHYHEAAGRLDGITIGVVREYMNVPPIEHESVTLVENAISSLQTLGARIVDPGVGHELFTQCLAQHGQGTLRSFGGVDEEDEARASLGVYLRDRGDMRIATIADLLARSRFFVDPHLPSERETLESLAKPRDYDPTPRVKRREAVRTILSQCMDAQKLDVVVYPSSSLPPLGLVERPPAAIEGRSRTGIWTFLPAQGFPTMSVPAGFTAGKLPVGIDLLARPFAESLLFRVAAAYEHATKHRAPPPALPPL